MLANRLFLGYDMNRDTVITFVSMCSNMCYYLTRHWPTWVFISRMWFTGSTISPVTESIRCYNVSSPRELSISTLQFQHTCQLSLIKPMRYSYPAGIILQKNPSSIPVRWIMRYSGEKALSDQVIYMVYKDIKATRGRVAAVLQQRL